MPRRTINTREDTDQKDSKHEEKRKGETDEQGKKNDIGRYMPLNRPTLDYLKNEKGGK